MRLSALLNQVGLPFGDVICNPSKANTARTTDDSPWVVPVNGPVAVAIRSKL